MTEQEDPPAPPEAADQDIQPLVQTVQTVQPQTSHDEPDEHSQLLPSPSPAPTHLRRRKTLPSKSKLRSKLLFLLITVLLAICIYASFIDDSMGEVEATISCGFCLALLMPLQALAHVGDDAFVDFFVGICTNLGIEDEDVCRGAVGTQAPILAHDLRHISLASYAAKAFCSTVFGLCPLQQVIPYTVSLSEPGKPFGIEAVRGGNGTTSMAGRAMEFEPMLKKWVGKGRKPFQVVHLSDVHVDRKYLVGASSVCSKVICCRDYGLDTMGPNVTFPAGKFGNKNCDSPPALADSMFSAIERLVPNRSFTIFTGDIIEAAVWAVSPPSVTEDMSKWFDEMESPSYPALGNHDVSPVNSFPRTTSLTTESQTSDWVFVLASQSWEKWIGAKGSEQVKKHYGCYSVVHPGTSLKIISVNTQYWYKQNFWLYDSDEPQWDPNGILSWMARELHQAESDGLRVWIIGHMPFGKVDALRDQSNYANQIFQRYAGTIAAHFYGHSHVDEFEISYPNYDDRRAETANGIAYMSGALTPSSGNPVFRVYDIDPDTYEVMDFVPYFANLTEPSFGINPEWKPYYSARDSYGSYLDPPIEKQASMDGKFWHRVTEVMEKDESVFQLFNTRLSRGGKIADCSSRACKSRTICMLRSMRAENNCIVIRPGLSFKDSKRSSEPTAEGDTGDDDDDGTATDRTGDLTMAYARSEVEMEDVDQWWRESEACEGVGLGSMLRKLGRGGLKDLRHMHAFASETVAFHRSNIQKGTTRYVRM